MCFCFFFKQKTAYEMRISDWSSDVCSSDLSNDDGQQRDPQAQLDGFQHHLQIEWLAEQTRVVGQCPLIVGNLSRHETPHAERGHQQQIGRASCRERVCQYV